MTQSRRSFLVSTAGLALAATMGGPRLAQAAGANPLAFVRIGADSSVTVLIKHLDMGQGIATGLATIVAEELDADWSKIRTEFAPANARLYNNLSFGPLQGTGGSSSIANSWLQLRKAGAAARQMLVEAAAAEWGVEPNNITVSKGLIRAGERSAPFGTFAAKAAQRPVPTEPQLKDPTQFTLIGKEGATPRVDSFAKTNGTAIYPLDIRRPHMVTALVMRSPKFGGRLLRFDDTKARAVAGVVDVLRIPSGIAVLASNTWAAMKGRDALSAEWDFSGAEMRSSAQIMADYEAKLAEDGLNAASRGAVSPLPAGARPVEGRFRFPYLAHAPIEPLNATLERHADGTLEAWGSFQMQTGDQAAIALVCDVPVSQVRLNTLWAGGSFGRHAIMPPDYVLELAHIAKAYGFKTPVHLVYSREDDMRAGYYRPTALHYVRAALGSDGRIAAWDQHIVTQPINMNTPLETTMAVNGIDHPSVEGAADTPYALPGFRVRLSYDRSPVPVLWWRSVGHSHTAFVMESMMDQLAKAAGQDAVAFRLAHLQEAPRLAAVLKLAAEKAGWGTTLPTGKGRGVAVHKSFGTHVGMVAEVSVSGKTVKVERIVAAVDCGIAINPDIVRAQVEGSVGFALSSVLRNALTLKDGLVEQGNFDGFEPTRMSEMPKVEVHIVASAEAPSGIGEPAVPVLGPAIGNAVAMATGGYSSGLPLRV